MSEISRNAPCPCGSGQKYKNCHLGKSLDVKAPRVIAPLLACVLGVGLGIYFGFSKGVVVGFSIGMGAVILVGLAWLFRDPPPPGKGGDPGAINFGG